MTQAGRFVWHELMTTDMGAAAAFYAYVTGWDMADSGIPGMTYTLASAGATRVAGLMTLPADVAAQGGKPGWIGYVATPDVDEAADHVAKAGGAIHRAPDDIPGIGRFCVVADPQGAVFVLFKGQGDPPEAPATPTPGHVGWNELHARDWEAAFAFYEKLFGWAKSTPVDMGPMGVYQLFGAPGGPDIGGMMTNTQVPAPFWLYYVAVDDIDSGHGRVIERGGRIIAGPHEVPGGSWIVHALDPQGAMFALLGPRAAG